MKQVIFYGAGGYAKLNINNWLKYCGYSPVCFADIDENKWNTTFTDIEGKSIEVGILPLSEAVERYPDYNICITTHPVDIEETSLFLQNNGVPKERIKHIYSFAKSDNIPRYCVKLTNQMVLCNANGKVFVTSCCYQNANGFKSTGDFRNDYNLWRNFTKNMADELEHGLFNSCIGCSLLTKEKPPSINENNQVSISISTGIPGGERCNFKCSYCMAKHQLSNLSISSYNVLDIVQWVADNLESTSTHIEYNAGEITISPFCEDILDLWLNKQWQGTIFSNCAVYNPKITELMRGDVNLCCSLDSGTPDTFRKIKGVDIYNRVVDNLRNYATSGGIIILKYIYVHGVNDNETDITKFLEIAKELSAVVFRGWDYTKTTIRLTEQQSKIAEYFDDLCREKEIVLSVDKYSRS